MEVAIMGAGLSGLSCAITLEQHGIIPTIFEKKSQVGDSFVHMQAIPNMIRHPIEDPIKHLSETHQIYIKPNANIRSYYVIGERETAHLTGHIGFTNIRGRHQRSLERQLYSQLHKTKIHFHSELTYQQLLNEYTHVVVATGDAGDAIKLNNFDEALAVHIKGATIKGTFNIQEVYMWLNDYYAPGGYAILIPFSQTEANMMIGFPIKNESIRKIDELWNNFSKAIKKLIQQDIQITDSFEIDNYIMGHASNPRIGNSFFVGNCYGALMPFMGFGEVESIMTGIYAAHDLLGMGDYEELTKPILESYKESLILRQAMNKLTNHGYDRLIKILDTPFAKKMLHIEQLNMIRVVSTLIKPFLLHD